MAEPVLLVCAADDAFAMPLAVTLRSAAETLGPGRRLEIFVLDGGVGEENRRAVEASLDASRVPTRSDPAGGSRCTVHWARPATERLRGARGQAGRISLATYFRILVADTLPREIERAIYLDCDVVVRSDLGELFDLDLGDNVLLAARDAAVQTLGGPLGLENFRELGLRADAPYFNAGVMLLDLARWRADDVTRAVLDHLDVHGDVARFWDQDALNAILAGRWGALDPRWNQIPQFRDYREWARNPFGAELCEAVIAAPHIVHYCTGAKPWHYGATHPDTALYFEVLDRTAFAGWRPRKGLLDSLLGRQLVRARWGVTRRIAGLRERRRARLRAGRRRASG